MSDMTIPKLELDAAIGFNGNVPCGLKVHPDKQHFIYPLGNTVIIEDIASGKQEFLCGHSNDVSCLTVSRSGQYLASGQNTHMGFKADIIIWEFKSREFYARLVLHMVRVEALAFSPNDIYLVSLGGQDDGSVVVWSVANKESICGSQAQIMSAGKTSCVCYTNADDNIFVTGGDATLRVWVLDLENRKIRPFDVKMGQLKRIINCIVMKDDDEYFYCGTTSGDILCVNLKTQLMQTHGPTKNLFSQGVTAIALLKNKYIIVGSGDGLVSILDYDFKKLNRECKLAGRITSIALRGQGHQFFCGTVASNKYRISYTEFNSEMISTCHSTPVNDIIFPFNESKLFLTCGKENIRVWETESGKELLRICVHNMTCNAIDLTRNGESIVSAWDDGKIRAFYPETGSIMYTINDAHNKGVTSLACASSCKMIVSGGGEGQVRVWHVDALCNRGEKTYVTHLVEAMKEHKGAVSAIKISKDDKKCVSASSDGTCIVWDLERYVRSQVMFANTLFRCVCHHPEEFQVVTSGTDRKIAFWEVCDGSMIRELEGSQSGSVNAMDMSPDGDFFVTGGDDKLIKVWNYGTGEVTHIGTGHSGCVNKVKVCRKSNYIISVSSDGAIIRWRFPKNNSQHHVKQ